MLQDRSCLGVAVSVVDVDLDSPLVGTYGIVVNSLPLCALVSSEARISASSQASSVIPVVRHVR